jgi:intein/homing endonuclease
MYVIELSEEDFAGQKIKWIKKPEKRKQLNIWRRREYERLRWDWDGTEVEVEVEVEKEMIFVAR